MGAVQISVPSDWLIEDPGVSCGDDVQGMVFIDQTPTPPPNGMGCGLPSNIVELSTASSTPLAGSHRTIINTIPVTEGTTRSGTTSAPAVRALGMQMDATGPLAAQVVATLSRSPLSVVLHSSVASVPAGWNHVVFGGIRLALPTRWMLRRQHSWGGCPGNLAANVLILSTAQQWSTPGCPAPPETAGYLAARPGMVIGSGPAVSAAPADATCLRHNGLRICIDPPPPPVGGFDPGHELNLLTAQITVPNQAAIDQVEIGLTGAGTTPLHILDSLQPADGGPITGASGR